MESVYETLKDEFKPRLGDEPGLLNKYIISQIDWIQVLYAVAMLCVILFIYNIFNSNWISVPLLFILIVCASKPKSKFGIKKYK